MPKPIYLDNNYSCEERAEDLVSKMTIEEAASQLTYNAVGIKRLNIPSYNWWNEALHGVARAGTATIFPQAIGLAAMFDEELLEKIGDTVGTEARAKYNEFSKKEDRDIYKGLTFWSPNVNIFRDPRWGRGHETYGEDPYLTSRLGVSYIKGLQGNKKYLKTAACAKHFAVHSGPEDVRHEFDAIVSKKDLYETYLPAFEACVKEGKVESVMGAYNRTNGEPCCGSETLLQNILRGDWEFDGHVVSDCWAISDFHNYHHITATAPESAALAIKNGCDLNCGVVYLQLLIALSENLITEEDIRTCTKRLMKTRIRLGMFDEDCEFDNIPYSENDSKENHKLSYEAATKSVVMLKNNGILPLNKSNIKSIAVIGPNADNKTMLEGNYCGTGSKYVTILEGIHNYCGDDIRVNFASGCHMYKENTEGLSLPNDRLSEAIITAENSDVVVLVLGIDTTIEGEDGDQGNIYASGDKPDLNLPGFQNELIKAVYKTNKPIILVLGTGSALAINNADNLCSAILNCWYPGSFGGDAVADIIFGKVSPSGKLPITFYNDYDVLPDFTDYSMKGRTYRYIENEPLYPFGYGLTYGKIKLKNLTHKIVDEKIYLNIDIKNTENVNIEEVLQVYVKINGSNYAPVNHTLVGFKRVKLAENEEKNVQLIVDKKQLQVVNNDGKSVFDGESGTIFVGVNQPDKKSIKLTNVNTEEITISIKELNM